jgi:hypothetical protein
MKTVLPEKRKMTVELENLIPLMTAAKRLGVSRQIVAAYVDGHRIQTFPLGPGRYLDAAGFEALRLALAERRSAADAQPHVAQSA